MKEYTKARVTKDGTKGKVHLIDEGGHALCGAGPVQGVEPTPTKDPCDCTRCYAKEPVGPIEGEVLICGRPKPYKGGSFGEVHTEKFFMEIRDNDATVHKCMVETGAYQTYNFEHLAHDEPASRQRPFIGDIVRVSTTNKAWQGGWLYMGMDEDYEITDHKGREAWAENKERARAEERARKDREWKEKREQQKAETKKAKEDEEAREKERIESLPVGVQKVFTHGRALKVERFFFLLRDIRYLGGKSGIQHGYGGQRNTLMDGDNSYPGVGLRGPSRALYNTPGKSRRSMLDAIVEEGYVAESKSTPWSHPGHEVVNNVEDENHFNEDNPERDDSYTITSKGIEVLDTLDKCPKCGTQYAPVRSEYRYVYMPRGPTIKDSTIIYSCLCEFEKNVPGKTIIAGCNHATWYEHTGVSRQMWGIKPMHIRPPKEPKDAPAGGKIVIKVTPSKAEVVCVDCQNEPPMPGQVLCVTCSDKEIADNLGQGAGKDENLITL